MGLGGDYPLGFGGWDGELGFGLGLGTFELLGAGLGGFPIFGIWCKSNSRENIYIYIYT